MSDLRIEYKDQLPDVVDKVNEALATRGLKFAPREGYHDAGVQEYELQGAAKPAAASPVAAALTQQLAVERTLLMIAFDCAVGSMDFTSGFFDDEEVQALRAIAAILGRDPITATPVREVGCDPEGPEWEAAPAVMRSGWEVAAQAAVTEEKRGRFALTPRQAVGLMRAKAIGVLQTIAGESWRRTEDRVTAASLLLRLNETEALAAVMLRADEKVAKPAKPRRASGKGKRGRGCR